MFSRIVSAELSIGVSRVAKVARPGVVDQDVDRDRMLVEMALQPPGGVRQGKIDGNDEDLDTVLRTELRGKLFHWLLPASRQHEVHFALSEKTREFNS
jgi:hypothetical protein